MSVYKVLIFYASAYCISLQSVPEYFDIWFQGHILGIYISLISFEFTDILEVITLGNISTIKHDYFKNVMLGAIFLTGIRISLVQTFSSK